MPSLAERSRPNAHQRGYCSKAWSQTRKAVLVRDNYQCRSCGRVCSGKREAQVDHVIPKDQGGSDLPDNLQTLCISCHARKTLAEHRPVC